MSFGPPPNKKVNQTKAMTSRSASQSGRSSPVIISRSASVALPQTATSTRNTTQATNRSASSSHATSHARTNRPPTPPRQNMTTQEGNIRASPIATGSSGQGRAATRNSPGRSGIELQTETTREEIILNSPTTSIERYTMDVQEAYDAAEEQEVWHLASPEKDEQEEDMLRQTGEEYRAADSGRPRRQMPFVTTRQPITSMMGSQFTPMFRTADTTTAKVGMLTEEIGGLRREIRDSSRNTNEAIAALIQEIRQDRRARSSASRSARGCSPGQQYTPEQELQHQAQAREETEEERSPVPEPTGYVPTRTMETPREGRRTQAEETIRQLADSGELDALIGLQRSELRRQQPEHLVLRRGQHESSPEYEARMNHNARARVVAELRSGTDPTMLFDRLYPGRRRARFEGRTDRRQQQPEPEPRRTEEHRTQYTSQGRTGQPNNPSPPPSESGGEDSNPHGESPPLRREPRHSSISRAGPRVSFYNSSIGRSTTATDRSSERTDEIIRKEINDAIRAVENRSEAINVGKMMKISLPEYIGGESIDAFLRFLREFLVYLINYNLMKPEADAHRVSLLGSALKDRALRWYQHTIHLNADGDWTFELAMIELKRYFVKDVSSRDAATRFDRLSQKQRTVTELKKDLERLSQQMIQTPSDYDMSRRFLNALKPEIAGTVVRYGINSENSDMEAIFEMAKSIEQGMFYEERQHTEYGGSKNAKEASNRPTTSKSGYRMRTTTRDDKPAPFKRKGQQTSRRNGREMKQTGPHMKTVECFLCKQKGHYSNECPKRAPGRRSANAEETEADEKLANAVKEDLSETEEEEIFSKGEDEGSPDEQEEQQESSSNEDGLSLEDWTCAARLTAESEEDSADSASEDEDDYIVYRGEPRSDNDRRLIDWSRTRGMSRRPEEMGSEDEAEYIAGLEQYCLATYLARDETQARSSKVNEQPSEQVAYRQRATKELGPFKIGDGPKRNFRCVGVIEGYMRINGHKAHVLLDGGSTLDMISANFAAVHKLEMFQLKKPLKLQMATSGSCSVINYGAKAELHVGALKEQRYFDVVNLDRYHVILGTPFLKHHGVLLNYDGHGSFRLKGSWFQVKDEEFSNPLSKKGEKTDEPAEKDKQREKAIKRKAIALRTNEAVDAPMSPKRKSKAKSAPDKRAH
ncbi:hypothetical protein AX14_002337 [Amanita brunnescens Koide BX004]|nr:hypothetical protein AX14_002337 [Amanita brunnescens Koide BX004]